MFEDSNIVVGLEIGTSKICVVVGEQNAEGAVNIIGLGQSLSSGVRKGEICDTEKVEQEVRAAIFEAEQMADVEIRSVYLGVTGGHIRGFNNRGVHPVVSADREISDDDVQDVIKNAKAINLPAENTVVHAVRQHFFVDGQDGVTNPVGMLGARLEVDMHVIHGHANRLQNAIRLVRATQLEVNEIVFTGIASALALLSSEQKELGALVIDIGGGTTEFVVYSEGVIRHAGVLAVGGDHVSNDLAFGLKVPLSRAQKLKHEYGSALITEAAKGQTISITNELGLTLKTVNLEHLQRIMSLRLEELFEIIAHELEKAGLTDYLRAGVFLCGGGSRVPAIAKLAERVFQMNVTHGHAGSMSGITAALDQPEFAAAIGLVKYGSLKNRRRERRGGLGGTLGSIKNMFGSFLQRS
ncbi:MAG TPA: cell division protein FtsA [Verrucomicrobia subdivision 3 bacterium]|nr:cell division protein FtsA [Limisphaerales bacterium]